VKAENSLQCLEEPNSGLYPEPKETRQKPRNNFPYYKCSFVTSKYKYLKYTFPFRLSTKFCKDFSWRISFSILPTQIRICNIRWNRRNGCFMPLFITHFVVMFLSTRNGGKPATNVERPENLKQSFPH
jgi:hypothetical protein